MNLRPLALAAAAAPIALLAIAPLAAAQTPAPVTPPSIAQVCAATGIAQVDELLDGVARSQLVGELSPLLSILVPTSTTAEVDASLQLADIRQRLNCAPTTTTPTTTPTTSAPPSVTTTPRTPAPSTTSTPRPSDGYSQVGSVPVGAAETGGGPAE